MAQPSPQWDPEMGWVPPALVCTGGIRQVERMGPLGEMSVHVSLGVEVVETGRQV